MMVPYVVTGALAGLALVLALPLFSDLLSLAKLPFRRRDVASPRATEALPSLAFLIPAHDEEKIVGEAVRSVRRLRYPCELVRLYVVADNCTDQTARVAREGGAACLVRTDPARPGKQHAIAWALKRFPFADSDAVVIVDADSILDQDFARGLAQAAPLRDKAVQSYNGVSNPTENALTRLAALLSAVYYEFMYPLRQRAGVNVPLTGAGMCVGSGLLERYGWTARAISENVEVYLQLSLAGERVECAPNARISSQEARGLKQSWTQRLRWRGGRLAVFRAMLGPMLRSSALGPHAKLDMASELLLPGPATQLGLAGVGLVVAVLAAPPAWLPIGSLLGAAAARWALYSSMALSRAPDPLRTLLAVGYLPVYILWRLGAEANALRWAGRDKPWIRTRRNTPEA